MPTTNETAYLRGRADERESIIGWLRAEAKDDPDYSWGAAFDWASKALSNIEPDSEVHGVSVRRMELPDEY